MQQGVTRIRNSPFYVTPDEPASPYDCDRWPDSPFCGGNPVVENPFRGRVPVGLDPEIIVNECDIGISVTPILGLRAPKVDFLYRKAECRERKEEKDFPPPKTNEINENYPPPNVDPRKNYLIYSFTIFGLSDSSEFFNRGKEIKGYAKSTAKGSVQKFVDLESHDIFRAQLTVEWSIYEFQNEDHALVTNSSAYERNYTEDVTVNLLRGSNFSYIPLSQNIGCSIRLLSGEDVNSRIWQKRFGRSYKNEKYAYNQIYWLKHSFIPLEIPPPPPPPPPPRLRCCMTCCPSPPPGNNQDLEEIKRMLRALIQIQGYYDFPVSAPRTLTKDDGSISIPNHAQFKSYLIRQLDALNGQYPIKIKVKDADPTKEGDQPVNLNLPNQAEAIAELTGLVLSLKAESAAILASNVKLLVQLGSCFQQSYLAREFSELIIDYLGFPTEEKIEEVNLTFTPGAEKISDLLKETSIKIRTEVYKEKEDFADQLQRILDAAAIIKAQNFRKIDLNNPIEALKSILKDKQEIAKKAQNETGEDSTGEIWDTFLESAERGFVDQPGMTDAEHPYGRDYTRRPKIREVGQQNPNTD